MNGVAVNGVEEGKSRGMIEQMRGVEGAGGRLSCKMLSVDLAGMVWIGGGMEEMQHCRECEIPLRGCRSAI